MTPANKKRLAAIGAVLVAGSALAALSMGSLEKNLVYYWSPQELLSKGGDAVGATIRLGGVVQKDSVRWDAKTLDLKFRLSESPEKLAAAVEVDSKGTPPQMFQEGIGAVVEGVYNGDVFHADRVMVKHSNEYRPPEGAKPNSYPTLVE
jgi:cytochrome c-type biogenesis protein CcmE